MEGGGWGGGVGGGTERERSLKSTFLFFRKSYSPGEREGEREGRKRRRRRAIKDVIKIIKIHKTRGIVET